MTRPAACDGWSAPPRQAHRGIPDEDIARARQQAQDIIGRWLASGWHPALTGRWHGRRRRLAAALPATVLADVIIYPRGCPQSRTC